MSMFTGLYKALLAVAAVEQLNSCGRASFRLARIELARIYLRCVIVARNSASSMIRISLMVGMMAMGLLLLHTALFMLLPWSMRVKAFLILGLGSLYTITAFIVIGNESSDENWIKNSGAHTLLKEALESESDG
ncbi:MAG: hypothetical protein JJU05_16005 [Verrucomicrobia bacterium]|nr:hypothetical protein [Verrucomicrobiota bacterium]MCH8528904.1 hypothetical protein [Kiritimatiellia bacterium]